LSICFGARLMADPVGKGAITERVGRPGVEPNGLSCPKCRKVLRPEGHAYLVFDELVWCDACHSYDRELIRPRDFAEIKAWGQLISRHFGLGEVPIQEETDPQFFRQTNSVVTAEADRGQRYIVIYPPGCRLVTICHELAHIATGQDHTFPWARAFARLVAWVKSRLEADQGPDGFPARMSIYAGIPKRVY